MTDLELAVALVSGVATPLSVVVVAWLGGRRIKQVHTLVDGRLDQALSEIGRLERRLTEHPLDVADLRNKPSSP